MMITINRHRGYGLRLRLNLFCFALMVMNSSNGNGSLPNSIVDACTVNAFKAPLDKFWQHQSVKFDFTADLTGTGNRSEIVIE